VQPCWKPWRRCALNGSSMLVRPSCHLPSASSCQLLTRAQRCTVWRPHPSCRAIARMPWPWPPAHAPPGGDDRPAPRTARPAPAAPAPLGARAAQGLRAGRTQAVTVAGHQALHRRGEVLPQVEPVGDLHRVRRALKGAQTRTWPVSCNFAPNHVLGSVAPLESPEAVLRVVEKAGRGRRVLMATICLLRLAHSRCNSADWDPGWRANGERPTLAWLRAWLFADLSRIARRWPPRRDRTRLRGRSVWHARVRRFRCRGRSRGSGAESASHGSRSRASGR
jgi:hypothetical protein